MSEQITFQAVVDHINTLQPFTVGGTWSLLSKLRKAFEYIYSRNNEEFPFKSGKSFNKEIRNYGPWKHLLLDLGTTKEKVLISYPKEFMREVEAWVMENKPHKSTGERGVTKEIFESAPLGSNIADTRVNFNDQSARVRNLNEMIDSNKGDCIALVTPPGLGKTEAAKEYILNQNPDTPVLVPSFRIALSEKQKADFEGCNFSHYMDKKFDKAPLIRMRDVLRLIVQVDSIHRVIEQIGNGILLLDEWESIVEHIFSSPYIKEKTKVVNRLVEYIRTTKTVIIADANLSQTSVDFFEQICHRAVKIYKNDHIRNPRELYFVGGKGALTEKIITLLNEGKKVYVPTNSKNYGRYLLKELIEKCPRKKVKMYDNETELLKGVDPIGDMINYDCCIATPKFQAGNSFTEDHFDTVCAYFSGASCSPEASSQLILRVRNLRERIVYMYVDNRLGPNKKVNNEINSFQDMRDLIIRQDSARKADHQYILSNGDVHNIKFDINGQVDMNDPTTFLATACMYNLNEGYKNYTLRLISLLKGMGFTFGGNLAQDTPESREFEKFTSKAIAKSRQQEELNNATDIAQVNTIDDKVANEIKDKIASRQTVTKQERDQLKKYNLLDTVKLLNPDDPSSYIEANKIRRPKILMNKLLGTARIDNKESEIHQLEETLNELANIKAIDPYQTKASARFYELDTSRKAIMIGYLLSCLRKLGFQRGFFDPLYIDIQKQEVVNYLIANQEQIETVFGSRFTQSQLTDKGVIRWLNSKLEPLLAIKLAPLSKDTKRDPRYKIVSPWRIIEHNSFAKVFHHPLEINLDEQTYLTNFVSTMLGLIEAMPEQAPPKRFEDCYTTDTNYPGSYVITNLVTWNRFVKGNTDPVFCEQAMKIYLGDKEYREYKSYEEQRWSNGKFAKSWNEWRQSKSENNTRQPFQLNVLRTIQSQEPPAKVPHHLQHPPGIVII